MKVFLVEFGEYSDRFISAVFSTREKALEYAKGGGYGEDCIMEFTVDEKSS